MLALFGLALFNLKYLFLSIGMYKVNLSLIVFYVLISSCQVSENTSKPTSLIIDPSLEKKGLKLSDLVSSEIEVIPLPNQDGSGEVVYINSINKLSFTDEYIFVLDYIFAGKLFQFTRDGEYVGSIGSRGEAPGQYLQIMDFEIKNDTITVLDFRKLLSYNISGEYIGTSRLEDLAPSGFSSFEKGFALLGSEFGVDHLNLASKDLSVKKTFFPYGTRVMNPLIINPLFKNGSGDLIFRRHLNDTLFEIKGIEKPEPYLIIDYRGLKLDPKIILENENPERYYSEVRTNYAITHYYYESDNYQYLAFFYDNEKWIYIYSNLTGKSILFKNSELLNDITQDPNSYLVGVYENRFVFGAKPDRVLASLKSQEDLINDDAYLTRLQQIVEPLDKEGNPILFSVEFEF